MIAFIGVRISWDIVDRKSVFVCDNNLNDERNLSNFIIVKNENEVKILLCGFPLTENNKKIKPEMNTKNNA